MFNGRRKDRFNEIPDSDLNQIKSIRVIARKTRRPALQPIALEFLKGQSRSASIVRSTEEERNDQDNESDDTELCAHLAEVLMERIRHILRSGEGKLSEPRLTRTTICDIGLTVVETLLEICNEL